MEQMTLSMSIIARLYVNFLDAFTIKYFDAMVGGDEVAKSKPDPEVFLKAASALHLAPVDCYVFEDSFNGVRAGHAAGALTVMIPVQVQPTPEIKEICLVKKSFHEALESIKAGEM